MLSKEAVKAKNKYKKLGAMISWMVTEPWNPKMWKVKLQRFNYYNVVAINPKSKGHKKEKLTLAGMETWKITTPNSDPEKILLYFHGGAYPVSYTHLTLPTKA